ncbi:MAG: hypothetical protein PHF37_10175 [Phycisphaerae bacterium]|nr:hypothetical protein [Phycisphaerae bacterium]
MIIFVCDGCGKQTPGINRHELPNKWNLRVSVGGTVAHSCSGPCDVVVQGKYPMCSIDTYPEAITVKCTD